MLTYAVAMSFRAARGTPRANALETPQAVEVFERAVPAHVQRAADVGEGRESEVLERGIPGDVEAPLDALEMAQ